MQPQLVARHMLRSHRLTVLSQCFRSAFAVLSLRGSNVVWWLELLAIGFDPVGSHVGLHISALTVATEAESLQAMQKRPPYTLSGRSRCPYPGLHPGRAPDQGVEG